MYCNGVTGVLRKPRSVPDSMSAAMGAKMNAVTIKHTTKPGKILAIRWRR